MAFVTTETRVAQATPVLACIAFEQAEIVTGKDGICEVDRLGEKKPDRSQAIKITEEVMCRYFNMGV